MENNQAPIPDLKLENNQENIQTPTFNENENIILNDPSDTSAGVVNKPVPIINSTEIESNSNNNEETELNPSKLNVVFAYIKSPFLKLGKMVQNLISKNKYNL